MRDRNSRMNVCSNSIHSGFLTIFRCSSRHTDVLPAEGGVSSEDHTSLTLLMRSPMLWQHYDFKRTFLLLSLQPVEEISMRKLMFPRRKFYRFFVSVVILLLICALVQFLSVNLIGFSSNNSLNRKTTPEERIRGVREKDRSLYISEHSNTFKCKDDSAVIRLNQVNDDYCDCESDGSDEPGTEACPNGK